MKHNGSSHATKLARSAKPQTEDKPLSVEEYTELRRAEEAKDLAKLLRLRESAAQRWREERRFGRNNPQISGEVRCIASSTTKG